LVERGSTGAVAVLGEGPVGLARFQLGLCAQVPAPELETVAGKYPLPRSSIGEGAEITTTAIARPRGLGCQQPMARAYAQVRPCEKAGGGRGEQPGRICSDTTASRVGRRPPGGVAQAEHELATAVLCVEIIG